MNTTNLQYVVVFKDETLCTVSGESLVFLGHPGPLCSLRWWFSARFSTISEAEHPSVPGSASSTDGSVFYHVEASCNGMLCPPHDPQKELTSAVCTK